MKRSIRSISRNKKVLKSGMNRIGALTVVKRVTWPHEVVHISDGKPAAYQDISVPSFVQGYLITMDSQDNTTKHRMMAEHLKDLISDAEMYGWGRTWAFHGVWMNQIQQGRAIAPG